MTDTFILQLPDIDDKVYYIPEFKQCETPITTLNIAGATTEKNKISDSNSSSSCSDSNSSDFLSTNDSFYYGFDYYDVESIYDSYSSITNTTTKTKNTIMMDINNNNNLFYDKSFSLESSLNIETHVKYLSPYIQNSFEDDCADISTKKTQFQTLPIIDSLTPSFEGCPQQFTIFSPAPLRSNDIYCSLLQTENLTYEQYLRSNEYNNEKNIVTNGCQCGNDYDFTSYYSKDCLKRSNSKRKNKKRDKKYKKKYLDLDILSTFSNYSSLFSKNDQKNTKIKKEISSDKNADNKKYKKNIEKISHNNIKENRLILKGSDSQKTENKLSNNVNSNLNYCSFDFNFITIIETKLNRYNTKTLGRLINSDSKNPENSIHNTNQDIMDKIRLQEVSYRFSKSYF
ncbi:uncharacterized protein PWA37_003637 [Arxiozyma heterogenica]|uniref:uncharacterized protein n=1 Tax=Arxiozyma heterogenica TaxID=278026 RepID=UPI002F171A0E